MTLESNRTPSVAGLSLDDTYRHTEASNESTHDCGHAVNPHPGSGRSSQPTGPGAAAGNSRPSSRHSKSNRPGKAPSSGRRGASRPPSAGCEAAPASKPLSAQYKIFVPRSKVHHTSVKSEHPKPGRPGSTTESAAGMRDDASMHTTQHARHDVDGEAGSGRQRRNYNKNNRNNKSKGKPRSNDVRGRKGGKSAIAVGGGRVFGGSLTASNEREGSEDDLGAGTAPPSTRGGGGAQDLSSTLARRLFSGSYECMICCDKVRARHAIWHCDKCWAIFHIGCLKKWVKSSAGDANWRCPGCQHARAAAPAHYVCFCGAVRDPEPTRGCTPHSCGQTCGRNRGPHCVHPCPLPCHPGPCPPCTAMAPEQWCFCGRLTYQPRCGADYDPTACIKSCGEVCGELLGCGQHKCEQPCHAGLCPPCPHEETQRCYCGRHTRTAKCGDGRPQQTVVTRQADNGREITAEETGYYDCGEICDEPLDCGIHKCERSCHPQPGPGAVHGECPLDPVRVPACHCGKQLAVDLGSPRSACTDPVPSCGQECGRPLEGCAHACKQVCHAGPCPPCEVAVETTCRCGSTKFQTECHRSHGSEQPQCERVCSKKRACRRHQCLVRCCPSDHVDTNGVVVPSERIAPGVTDPHQCTMTCGRLLRCKNHQCEDMCHRGPCAPCRNTSYEELACACGRTRLLPPIACGTKLPACRYPCQRVRECGHISMMTHECHPDNTPCPPCPVLVAAQCMCGGREMRNVPCHRSHAASCGSICGKLLPCGGHTCQRSCHRADEPCLRGQSCRQPCRKPRKACGHPCPLPCHSPAMCDESRACDTLVSVSCACGRMSVQQACGATAATTARSRRIPCNEVCKIAERNRRLALALDMKDRADAPLTGLVRASYSDDLLQFTRAHGVWVRDIETMAAAFIGERTRPTLHFAPMKQQYRAFLHALSPFYGCRSRSMDHEPLRSVCWDRTVQATIPSISLSNAVRYVHVPQMVCSSQVNADDSDFDDTASHDFDFGCGASGSGARAPVSVSERLRRKIDYIVISDLRHALTEGELRVEIDRLLPQTAYIVRWVDEDRVEMYCRDAAVKNETLAKWETVLRSKLPLKGVAGMVKGERTVPAAAAEPADSKCSGSPANLTSNVPSAPGSAAEASDDSVPDDWESLNF
ncbi:FKBP12-associated protein [Coemansia sp. RSA 2704]|nr:FKBP12-associated protein [Coemansia sp. RSA 2704]